MNAIIRMHGTLMAIVKKVIGYVQRWTKDNLPPEVMTEHYFNVGEFEFPPIDYNRGKVLPDGYTKLSYITNTDNGYIDTDYKLQANDNVEIICKLNSYTGNYPPLFGARTANCNNCYLLWTRFSNSTPNYARGNIETSGSADSLPWNKYIHVITNGLDISWYDKSGTKISGIKNTGTLTNTAYSCFIFSVNNAGSQYTNGNVRANISNFIIKDGTGAIIHDYVPAMRNSDSAYGLYDVISNEFHQGSNATIVGAQIINGSKIPAKAIPYDEIGYNNRIVQSEILEANYDKLGYSNTLIKSNIQESYHDKIGYNNQIVNLVLEESLHDKIGYENSLIETADIDINMFHSDYNMDAFIPDGYEKLSALVFNDCYIDTGYDFNFNTGDMIEITALPLQGKNTTYQCLLYKYWHYNAYGQDEDEIELYTKNNTMPLFQGFRVGSSVTFLNEYGTVYKYVITNNNLKLYNADTDEKIEEFVTTRRYPIYTTMQRLWLGCKGTYKSDYTYSRVYRMTVKNGDLTKLHLVPCRRLTDGVLGMYDTISETFKENIGPGSFTAIEI